MASVTNVKWNPFLSGYFDDPYGHLRACRESNPIQQLDDGTFIFFRHREVQDLLRLRDLETSSMSGFFRQKEPYIFKGTGQCPHLSKAFKWWPMYLNHDAHKRMRAALGKAFQSLPVGDFILSASEENNRRFTGMERFDLLDYVGQYVFHVIRRMFGLDEDARFEQMAAFSRMLGAGIDFYVPKQTYHKLNELIEWGRRILPDSPFRDVILSETADLGLGEEDIFSLLLVSFFTVFETSVGSLSIALAEMMRHPDIREHILRCDARQLNLVVEECFRFTTPTQYTIRINKAPLEVEGWQIPEDTQLYLCLASANRDETVFERPDELVPDRVHNPHVAFAGGLHLCLGATIARQELRLGLQPMLAFLADYEMEPDRPVRYQRNVLLRTPVSVPLQRRS